MSRTFAIAFLLSSGCGTSGGGTSGEAEGTVGANSTGAGTAGAGTAGQQPGRVEVLGVETWRGGAAGAYTIIHDDACLASVDGIHDNAAPELAARGLRVGVAPIAQECDAADY